MGTGSPFGVMRSFGTRQRCCLHSLANVPNATELDVVKWLILRYLNFTSIKKNPK